MTGHGICKTGAIWISMHNAITRLAVSRDLGLGIISLAIFWHSIFTNK